MKAIYIVYIKNFIRNFIRNLTRNLIGNKSIILAVIVFISFVVILVPGCVRKPLAADSVAVETIAANESPTIAETAPVAPVQMPDVSTANPSASIATPPENPERKRLEYPILETKIICIDPGHQSIANYGKEPIAPGSSRLKEKMTFGTAGTATKVPEYQLNLEVSLKLKEQLEATNAKVIMTRETDNVDISNVERALYANKGNPDIVVRIHADGIENPDVKGTSVLYPGKEYIQDNKLLENSKKAAKLILEAIINNTHASPKGVIERNDMTGFNWSERPVILIEMGFMTNPAEDRLMNSEDYQNKIVKGILQGLSAYFETFQ